MSVSNICFPFPIDERPVTVFCKPSPGHWRDAAEAKGFRLIGRGQDRLHVILGCLRCGAATLKRISVVLNHNPECPHCISARRAAAAASVGARLVGADPQSDRHYGLYMLNCGHTERRQHHRVESAAAGGHNLSCETCTHDRHASEAEDQDWALIGPAKHRSVSYRSYEHVCGHRQSVAVANMRHGDVDCAGCGQSWSSKPSKIYLLGFKLPDIEVLKLGFSSNPEFRVRQVQYNPELTRGKVLRTINVATGHDAICKEKALHSYIKSDRPELTVEPTVFKEHIRTVSEIYHSCGRTYLEHLMSALEDGWDPRSGEPPRAA